LLIDALQREGCLIGLPRYPLVHQQPLFTEGHYRSVLRCECTDLPDYASLRLPVTEAANQSMIKLPSFPNADRQLLDQYITSFEKVLHYEDAILERT
jgi:dTDP-4-amino-4,6-dideoxygalactose transaminase